MHVGKAYLICFRIFYYIKKKFLPSKIVTDFGIYEKGQKIKYSVRWDAHFQASLVHLGRAWHQD